jgi:hypothetical protein
VDDPVHFVVALRGGGKVGVQHQAVIHRRESYFRSGGAARGRWHPDWIVRTDAFSARESVVFPAFRRRHPHGVVRTRALHPR